MADIILGAKIQIDTGGSTQAISSTVKGMNDVGNAAKAAQAQFAALSQQAQKSASSFVSLSNALGMNKAAEIAKNALEAQKAMGMLGATALAGNKAVAASVGSSSNIMAALTGNLKAAGVEMEKTAAKSEKASNKMAQANEKVGLSIRGWMPHMRTAAASIGVYFGVRAVANVIRLADAYTDMTSRLKLVSGTTQELTRAQEGLFRIAQANRSPLAETANLYYKLAVSMKEYGAAQKDVLGIVDTVGKAMRISGSSTIETGAAMMQLSQAFAKGKLDGDEFRSTMENAPRLMKALTDEFKISKEELYRWSETGTLSVERMMTALKNQSATIEKEFSTIPITISGAWTQLSNAVMKYLGDADQAKGASRSLAEAISDLAERFEPLADLVATIFTPVLNGLSAIIDALTGVKVAVVAIYESLSKLSSTEALQWFLAPDIKAWTVVKEALGLAITKSRDGYNAAISTGEWNLRREANGYATRQSTMPTPSMDLEAAGVQVGRYKGDVIGLDKLKQMGPEIVQAIIGAAKLWMQEQGGKAKVIITDVGRGEGDLGNHSKGYAADAQLVDANGRMVPRRFSKGADYRKYEQFWQDGLAYAMSIYGPEVEKYMRSGLHFLNRVGNDPMHADIRRKYEPNVSAGAGGNLRDGANSAMRAKYPGIVSQGIPNGDWLAYGKSRFGPDYQFGKAGQTPFFDGNNTMAKAMQGLTDIQTLIFKTATQYKINPALMLGLAQQESNFNPAALNPTGGDRGLFQFIEKTWTSVQSKAKLPTDFNDAFDPKKSADAAARLLVELQGIFKDNIPAIIAAYNAGAPAIQKAIRENRDIASVATKGHVKNVLGNMQNWTGVLGGNAEIKESDRQAYLKDFEKIQQEQYKAVVDRLKLQEQATDSHYKQQAEKQRTYMVQLEADRAAAAERNKSAIATATPMGGQALQDALKKEESDRLAFEERKKKAALEGLALDDKITQNKIANIKKQIEEAQKAERFTEVPALQQDLKSEEAQLKINAERRVQLTIEADARIRESRRDLEQDRRAADKQAADDNAAVQRNRIEGLQAEFAIQKQLAEASLDAFSQWGDEQKAAIDLTLEGAKAEAANRLAQRESLLEGKDGLAAIAQQRENINATLQDQLLLLQQEYDATVQKLELDRQALEYQKQMAEWQARRIAEIDPTDQSALITARQKVADIEASIAKNQWEQVKAAAELATAQGKASAAATTKQVSLDTKEVRERQLEENAFWDQYLSRLQDYATLWREITGESVNGWARMAVAAGEYGKQVAQISEYWSQDKQKAGWGEEGAAMMEALQQGQAAAAMMAKTMMAARDNVKEGSKEYQNLTTAAENFMAVLQLLNVMEGIAAVLKQLKDGDPYTAAVRAAAVAMQVASMGLQTGFNGSTAPPSINRSGTGGGVFGGKEDEYSNSIQDSLDLIAENTSNDLNYSAEMVRALRSIEAALAGVTNQVIRGVTPSMTKQLGTLKTGNDIFAFGMKGFDPLADAIFSFVFNVSRKITAYGLQGFSQSFNEILTKGFKGLTFTDFETTTKVFMMTVSKKLETVYGKLNKDVANQLTLVFRGIADALKEGGKAFGLSAEDTMKRIGNVKLNLGRIDLAGKSSKEIQETLSKAFSKMTDKLAKRLFPGLDEFLQVGEGYSKTFFRVAEGINRSTGILEQSGFTAISYKDIKNKQGDVAAEIVRQTLLTQAMLTDGVRQYVDELTGSAEDIMAAYKQLVEASALMRSSGVKGGDTNLNRVMINAAGGLDAFVKGMQDFTENFLSAGAQMAGQADQIYGQMLRIIPAGTAIPTTLDGFRDLVQGLDTTEASGQKLFGQLIAISGAFADMEKQLQSIREKYAGNDPLANLKKTIAEITTDFDTLIKAELAKISATGPKAKEIADLKGKKNSLVYGAKGQEDLTADIAELTADRTKLEALIKAETDKKVKRDKDKIKKWQKQLKAVNSKLASLNSDLKVIESAIADIDSQINDAQAGNDGALTEKLNASRAELIAQRGSAILQAVQDAWDAMTQGIVAAYDALKSVQDDILTLQGEITGGVGGKIAVTSARKALAAGAYQGYVAGGDMTPEKLAELSNKYRQAIMDEYNAKLEAINEPKRLLEAERDAQQKVHDEAIAALEKQLGVARELYDAVKNIQKYVQSLKLSQASTLSPERKLAEAQRQYQELLLKAQGGDAKALQEITGASDAYLEAAKQFFGSSTGYTSIFDTILKQMADLGNINVEDAETIQDKIDALNKDHEVYLKGIEDKIAALHIEDQIKELQEATVKELQALQDSLNGTGPDGTVGAIEIAAENARKQMADLIAYAYDANLLNEQQLAALKAMAEKMGVAIPDAPKPETPAPSAPVPETPAPGAPGEQAPPPSTSQYTDAQIAEFKSQRAAYQAKIDEAKRKIDKASADGIQEAEIPYIREWKANIEKWKAARDKIPAYARGGYASAGLALVGEEGPEIVNFERPAQVLTAKDTREALNGGGKTFAALEDIKREIAALVRTQAGANPEIITELQTLNRRMDNIERQQRIKA